MPPLYPAGLAGAGLLILRFSVAGSLLALNRPFTGADDWVQVMTLIVAIALCAGVKTRAVAVFFCIWALGTLVREDAWNLSGVLHAAISLALALTGPGAYSADGQLFGRRRVRLPRRTDTSE